MKHKWPVRVVNITASFKDGDIFEYEFTIVKNNFSTRKRPNFILEDIQHITVNFKP